MSYKVAPLTVNPKQKSALTSKVFVSQPSAEEEALVGRLFVLMEFDASRADDFAAADFIVKEIYRHYYENEQFFLRDKIANLKIDYVFEAALTKLNRGISEFFENEKIQLRPGALTMVIGVLHKNRLLFAQTGTGKAMLFYRPKTKAGELLSDYTLVDISEKTEDPTQEISTQNKMFANVINGLVPTGGYFLFANEALLEYLSKKQLTEIVTTLPPAGAAEQMKNLLEQTDAFVPFFALIIKNTAGEDPVVSGYAVPQAMASLGVSPAGGGRSSVDQLNLTQEKTEQLLTASGVGNLKKWLERMRPAGNSLKTFAEQKGHQLGLATTRLNSKRQKLEMGRKTFDVIRIIGSVISDGFIFAYKVIADPAVRANSGAGAKNFFKNILRSITGTVARFQRLQPKHKIILGVIIFAILAFAGNLVYSGIIRTQREAKARLTEAQTLFEQKEHQLEASLLYNNEEGARKILDEMGALLTDLPNKSEEDKAAVADLTNRYHARLDSLYHITRLTSPAPYVELPAEADSAVIADGILYAVNGGAKTLYRVAADKTVSQTNFSGSGKTALMIHDDGGIYAWDSENIFTYDQAAATLSATTLENRPDSLSAVSLYNDRLYAVAGSSIYRFNQDKPGRKFYSRQDWLKETADLKDATSLAIDGRLYVLANNEIKKFSGGQNETLVLDDVSPALETPTAVAVSPDNDFLYVLDPKNKRLLVYTEDGKYSAQYMSDSFDNLKAVTVDGAAKQIYLANGNKIYQIAVK